MKRYLSILICFLLSVSINSVYPQTDITGQEKRYEFTHSKMGSLFRVITYSNDEEIAVEAALEAFNRIDVLNQVFSDYIPDSECMQLSRKSGSGEYEQVSDLMFQILKQSRAWSERTSGAFDVTIGSLSQLWRRAYRKEKIPDQIEIEKALAAVGYKNIWTVSGHQTVMLEKPGMYLDFGGIVKGFAVDEVYGIFANHGLKCTLVDGGGDIYAGNPPPGRDGWKVMIRNQDNNERYIIIQNSSIATSGDLYRFIEIDGKRYSHIIDPRTGYGITIPRTVTVIAENATSADIMASALSVTGPEGFTMMEGLEMKAIIIQEVEGKLQKWERGKVELLE
ncbi:FAD:protein FMN transferase [Bacteroidota bacterium]